MQKIATLFLRVLIVAVCCFSTWMSVRHARADLAGAPGTAEAFERGLSIEPENVEQIVWAALLKSYSGDPSPAVDEQLLHAAQVNPMSSEVLLALAQRAELRGDNALAERYYVHATEVDHTFRPASAYANFCVRTGQPDKFWPMAKRCLNLDPLLFDPGPIFDLAWHLTDDEAKIRGILPQTGAPLVAYLSYLLRTNRTDIAVAVWSEALKAADLSDPANRDLMVGYCTYMAAAGRMAEAVEGWNQLVSRGIVSGSPLDPAKGVSISDSDLRFVPAKGLFNWQVSGDEGVFITGSASGLRLELDGNEPESFVALSTTAPILPGKSYRLTWAYDSSQLSAPQDPGFEIRIVQNPGKQTTVCQPFLGRGETGACTFTAAADVGQASVGLRYARASGTTRPRGTLLISRIGLEFAHAN
jgi:hypothetical protein